MTRVLVVEDDVEISGPLARALTREGYTVEVVAGGVDAVRRAADGQLDLMLLDLGLPGLDGLEVCRRARAVHPSLPILMLTARSEEIDLVVGLDAGADDYVAKPFRVAELLARIRALVRRSQLAPVPTSPGRHGVHVDASARRAWLDGEELSLSPKEFDLLAVFVREAGRAITREALIDEVWDEHWFGPTKTLDMHVSSLRRKLGDDPAQPRFITTLRGVGYRFELG